MFSGDRVARHRRQVIEPEFIAEGTDSEDERARRPDDDESSEEEELDDEEIERRRTLLRQRALQRKQEEVIWLYCYQLFHVSYRNEKLVEESLKLVIKRH